MYLEEGVNIFGKVLCALWQGSVEITPHACQAVLCILQLVCPWPVSFVCTGNWDLEGMNLLLQRKAGELDNFRGSSE